MMIVVLSIKAKNNYDVSQDGRVTFKKFPKRNNYFKFIIQKGSNCNICTLHEFIGEN